MVGKMKRIQQPIIVQAALRARGQEPQAPLLARD